MEYDTALVAPAATRAVLFRRSWNKALAGGRIDVIVKVL